MWFIAPELRDPLIIYIYDSTDESDRTYSVSRAGVILVHFDVWPT